MSNYGESYYLEELEEIQKEKVVTIIPDKQTVIDKSDLDFIYKQKADLEAKLAESEKLIFAYQNIIRQKPETATEMCEFIQPYERKLGKQELEIKQLKQQLAEKEKELVVKEQSRLDWKERANIYGDLIVSLNNFLPNKQEEEITFAKVIEDVKSLIAEKDAEIRVAYSFRKQKCDNLQKALAEKDEQLQQAIEMINNPDTLFYQQQELIDNLKVQLAEKDKLLSMYPRIEEMYPPQMIKLTNQDKISFAVEQLEKAKGKIQHNILFVDCDDYVNVIEEIDNQIASLKKGVE